PVPPSKRIERVIPRDLEHIVLECLSKDPRRRPQTASGLADRLAVLGIEGSWTRQRAESWWREHAPQMMGKASDPGARGPPPGDDRATRRPYLTSRGARRERSRDARPG